MSGYGNTESIWIEPRSELGSGPVIATVHVTNRNNQARARADANARLIAAAPDLLSVCRNLVNAVDLLHSGPQAYTAYQELCGKLVSGAREAIARAEGK